MTYTVGCVPYLNAKPLVRLFEDRPEDTPVRVVYDVPSRLPALLRAGEVDAIMVSSIEALRTPGKRIADGVAIASQKEVMSVRLFSKLPPRAIRSLALDESSMTSNALAQIILRERYDLEVMGDAMPPDLDTMLDEHDAAVLIGDNGMRASGEGLHVLDLGWEWKRLARLPFVWALWMGDERLTPELSMWLNTAAIYGAAQMPRVVEIACRETGFPRPVCEHYLTRIMDYAFDEPHRQGLHEFGRYLRRHGIVRPIHFPAIVGADFNEVESTARTLADRSATGAGIIQAPVGM